MPSETLTATTTTVTKVGERVIFPYPFGWSPSDFSTDAPVLKVGGVTLPITFSVSYDRVGAVLTVGAGSEIPAGVMTIDTGETYASAGTILGAAQYPGCFNFVPSRNLTKWSTAISNVAAGVSDARVVLAGDSTGVGNNAGATNDTLRWQRNVLHHAALSFAAVTGVNVCRDSFFAQSGLSLNDSRITGSGWVDGAEQFTATSAATRTFAPVEPWDRAKIYCFSGANFSAKVNAGSATNSPASGNLIEFVISATLGVNTLTLDWVTGNASVYAVIFEDTTKKKVHFLNMSAGGATIDRYFTASTVSAKMRTIIPGKIIPQLGIIATTINDAGGLTDIPTYKSKLQSTAEYMRLSGDVIFMTGIPSNRAQSLMDTYQTAMAEVAAALDAPFINLQGALMKDWTTANALSLMADDLHGTPTYYATHGRMLGQRLAV